MRAVTRLLAWLCAWMWSSPASGVNTPHESGSIFVVDAWISPWLRMACIATRKSIVFVGQPRKTCEYWVGSNAERPLEPLCHMPSCPGEMIARDMTQSTIFWPTSSPQSPQMHKEALLLPLPHPTLPAPLKSRIIRKASDVGPSAARRRHRWSCCTSERSYILEHDQRRIYEGSWRRMARDDAR